MTQTGQGWGASDKHKGQQWLGRNATKENGPKPSSAVQGVGRFTLLRDLARGSRGRRFIPGVSWICGQTGQVGKGSQENTSGWQH